MAVPIFTITQGTTAPALEMTLLDPNGPVPLTGATSVTFDMRNASDGTLTISGAAAVISDASAGKVRYNWAVGNTAIVGAYQGKFTVTWTDGKTTAWPTNPLSVENYIIINIVDNAQAVN